MWPAPCLVCLRTGYLKKKCCKSVQSLVFPFSNGKLRASLAAIFEQRHFGPSMRDHGSKRSISHRMLGLVWNVCSKGRSKEKVWLSNSTIKSSSGAWASIIQCGGTTWATQVPVIRQKVTTIHDRPDHKCKCCNSRPSKPP